MSGRKSLAYERKEKKIIDRIAKDSAKLKKMQQGEIKGMKHHKHHK